jgi:hypothetical protein
MGGQPPFAVARPDRPQGQKRPFVALPLPGVRVFGKTSKMGQRDIRNLPIIGAMALVRDSSWAQEHHGLARPYAGA